MANINALLGLGVDDEMKTRALANKLRGRDEAAQFFGMSTIAPLAQAAQAEQQSVQGAAERAGVLRKALADREAQAQLATDAQAARAAEGALERTSREEQAELDRQSRERVAGMRQSQAGSNRALERRADKLDTSLQKYSKDLEKSNLPRVQEDIALVDEIIAGLPRNEEGVIEEVPGIGYGQNMPYLGGALTFAEEAFSPEGSPGDTASQMRSAFQRVLNTEIRTQSGAAVTLQEMVRNRLGSAAGTFDSDEDFLRFWPVIKETLAAVQANYDAGYGPEVQEIYNRRQAGEALTTREYLEGSTPQGGQKALEDMTEEELLAELNG